MQVLADEVMGRTGAQTNYCLALACHIPCQPNAGIKVPIAALNSRFAVEPRIARINESRRSSGNDRALNTGIEFGEAEVINVALREGHRKKRRPVDAVGHRQLWIHF